MMWEKTDRIWCRDCDFEPVFTYGTLFYEKHRSCGHVLLAFTLCTETLLNIDQIARPIRLVNPAIQPLIVPLSGLSAVRDTSASE
jgi:hypothetical protein